MTKRLDYTWRKWAKPVNLGPAVNTTGFEGYFILDKTGKTAYFTGEDAAKEDTDIYTVAVADIFAYPVSPATQEQIKSASTETAKKEAVIRKTTQIKFTVNSAGLTAEEAKNTSALLAQIDLNKQIIFTITGHADETGDEAKNITLSEKRAQAIYEYLRKQGVPAAQMQVKAFGSQKPVAPNTSATNRAQNRRVEILVE